MQKNQHKRKYMQLQKQNKNLCFFKTDQEKSLTKQLTFNHGII